MRSPRRRDRFLREFVGLVAAVVFATCGWRLMLQGNAAAYVFSAIAYVLALILISDLLERLPAMWPFKKKASPPPPPPDELVFLWTADLDPPRMEQFRKSVLRYDANDGSIWHYHCDIPCFRTEKEAWAYHYRKLDEEVQDARAAILQYEKDLKELEAKQLAAVDKFEQNADAWAAEIISGHVEFKLGRINSKLDEAENTAKVLLEPAREEK